MSYMLRANSEKTELLIFKRLKQLMQFFPIRIYVKSTMIKVEFLQLMIIARGTPKKVVNSKNKNRFLMTLRTQI